MLTRLPAFAVMAALLLAARSRPAQACGALPTPYMTLATTQAADGATGVPLDAPLVIRGTAWPTNDIFVPDQVFEVTVKAAGSTTPVAGKVSGFFERVVWAPAAPLAPSTTYEVTVHVANQDPAPADATGPTDQSFSFTTGTASLAPLALTGEPAYSFETHDFPYCAPEDSNDCGGCSKPTTRTRPAVLVTPPTVSGGASSEGVFVMAWLDSGDGLTPGTVHVGGGLIPGQTGPIVLDLPDEGAPYQACLHVEVRDAVNHQLSTETRCFEASVTTADTSAGLGDTPPVTTPPASSGSSADGSDGGCNTSGQSGPGGFLLMGLAALVARMTRRQLLAR